MAGDTNVDGGAIVDPQRDAMRAWSQWSQRVFVRCVQAARAVSRHLLSVDPAATGPFNPLQLQSPHAVAGRVWDLEFTLVPGRTAIEMGRDQDPQFVHASRIGVACTGPLEIGYGGLGITPRLRVKRCAQPVRGE